MKRRSFLKKSSLASMAAAAQNLAGDAHLPNIVLILADDLGYGDLGCYGSRIKTPNLDAMAEEGVRFTNFYAASPLCSPSRAALLTGRYGVRSGVHTVLFPRSQSGLPESETTIAQILKPAGYATKCVGKWHLGRPTSFLPTNRGFDSYYGIPYSNDMDPCVLMRDLDAIETPCNLSTLTRRYTEEATGFIEGSKDRPFFLYLPHTSPHIPLVASREFAGKSSLGAYGDVVQELDWSVGQILKALRYNGVDHNTLVIFTSDNGPWFQGSPGRLRGRKGDTFEGGMRSPFIARFPGRIPQGKVVNSFATALDILPTIASLTQTALPSNPLDGVDITTVLNGEAEAVARPPFLYFNSWDLQCARLGRWKLHMARANSPAFSAEPKAGYHNLRLVNPELYDLESDPEEAEDTSTDNPQIIGDIQRQVDSMLTDLPFEVQRAWRATQERPVVPNEPGSWPRMPD